MTEITHIVDTKTVNGKPTNIVRNYFLCEKPKDWFKESHSLFTKQEKKLAKLQHKQNSLK